MYTGAGFCCSSNSAECDMKRARRLLRETNKSVVPVALDVGYTNPSHFARLLRGETGLSPSDYRSRR